MEREVSGYFEDLFKETGGRKRDAEEELLEAIPTLVTEGMNRELIKEITTEEVERTILEMSKDKAPGPDGFFASFFQEYWEIVKEDVVEAIQEFQQNGRILKEWQATFLALIPKKEDFIRT